MKFEFPWRRNGEGKSKTNEKKSFRDAIVSQTQAHTHKPCVILVFWKRAIQKILANKVLLVVVCLHTQVNSSERKEPKKKAMFSPFTRIARRRNVVQSDREKNFNDQSIRPGGGGGKRSRDKRSELHSDWKSDRLFAWATNWICIQICSLSKSQLNANARREEVSEWVCLQRMAIKTTDDISDFEKKSSVR